MHLTVGFSPPSTVRLSPPLRALCAISICPEAVQLLTSEGDDPMCCLRPSCLLPLPLLYSTPLQCRAPRRFDGPTAGDAALFILFRRDAAGLDISVEYSVPRRLLPYQLVKRHARGSTKMGQLKFEFGTACGDCTKIH